MAAPAPATIPRFLLPQSGAIWRRATRITTMTTTTTTTTGFAAGVRRASGKPAAKPMVLEKPARFNPPSHGSRLPKKTPPRHYGGDLGAHEVRAQGQRDYPGLMAPRGTWQYWFWHSRALHLTITLGTLASLSLYTFVLNFQANSPYADMVPPISDFLYHPISYVHTMLEVVRLNEIHTSAIVAEKRKKRVDDVQKRSDYRKAHGLEKEGVFGSWTAKSDAESLGPALPTGGDPPQEGEDRRKKWFGIF